MNFRIFKQTFNSIVSENTFLRIANVAMLVVTGIALIGMLSKDYVTILVPPTLNEKAEISNSAASASYKKSWALYISGLLGNITPGNAEFVFSSIESILSPDVYNNVKKGMNNEVQMMKRDGVTVAFSPRQVIYEEPTNKIFITGRTSISATTGEISAFDRVYEIEINIKAAQPTVAYLDSYAGAPKTKDLVERMNRTATAQYVDKANQETKKQLENKKKLEAKPINKEEVIQHD